MQILNFTVKAILHHAVITLRSSPEVFSYWRDHFCLCGPAYGYTRNSNYQDIDHLWYKADHRNHFYFFQRGILSIRYLFNIVTRTHDCTLRLFTKPMPFYHFPLDSTRLQFPEDSSYIVRRSRAPLTSYPS